jgi:hypothetical protein
MNIEPVLAGLLRFGEDEWIGLWVIADDVAQDLGVDDWAENLEATLPWSGSSLGAATVQEIHLLRTTPFTSQPGPTRMSKLSLISSDGNGCAEQTFLAGVTLHGSLPRDSAASMPELDGVREQLVYLRLWLGIIVVAEISLIGWTASAVDTASPRLLTLAFAVTMVLAMGIFLLHRRIKRRIEHVWGL